MSDRYFAKVVSVQDTYTVVINAGAEKGVKVGMKLLIVGLGEAIVDPDTNEELERLEIVRGTGVVVHVQEKIATVESAEYDKGFEEKEIKKVTSRGGLGLLVLSGGAQDTVTETIKPGEKVLRQFRKSQIGDLAISI